MLLGARIGSFGGAKEPTARDYVQSGLFAMWDGVENSSWGTHTDNATAWTDLVGGVSIQLNGRTVGDDFVGQRNGDTRSRATLTDLITKYQSGSYSQEIVYRVNESVASATQGFVNICGIGFFGKYSNANANTNFYGRVGSWQSYFNITGTPFIGSITMTLSDSGSVRYLKGVKTLTSTASASHATGSSYVELPAMDKQFSVDIFCIRLYERIITADEIAANYAIDKARFGLE